MSDDGALHLMSTDLKCNTHMQIGESSLVTVLSHDFVSQSPGPELLVATNDGTLICIGSSQERGEEKPSEDEEELVHREMYLKALPSETKHVNDFSFDSQKVKGIKFLCIFILIVYLTHI